MNFSEKLKDLRKSKNMSQEQLAEKLFVSRQAITKWENGAGLPDIENIVAIGALFGESLDNLLSEEKSLMSKRDFLYESRVEYDLDEQKTIDINFGTAREIIAERTKNEKLEILLASNKLTALDKNFKVKLEEVRGRMDVKIKSSAEVSSSSSKQDLFVFVKIPEKFVAHLELNGNAENLRVRDIDFDNIEFGGKFNSGFITNAKGHIELDTNSDVEVLVDGFKGQVDFNQINANSVLKIKNGKYQLRRIRKWNKFVDRDNKIIELKNDGSETADFIVETAGFGSNIKIMEE